MFEGFLEKFLLKYFGEYLKGIDKSNLKVAVWKGEIQVRTVDLNPDILRRLNLPLKMIFGKIDSLLLKVPWNNLSSKPVELTIENISLVLAAEDVLRWYGEKTYLDYCQTIIGDIKEQMAKKLEEEFEKQEKKSSFFEQIFDNLIINVKNINLRVESTLGQHYCFGTVLEDFSIQSVDKDGKSVFVKRASAMDEVTKLISFKNLILFYDTTTISGLTYSQIEKYFQDHIKGNQHKILNLNLDLIFTLTPYNRKDPQGARFKPIYRLQTEVNCVEMIFETDMIKNMADILDYFELHNKTKLE
jgi:vacuolar protein sorting-associated protein 13A/C